MSEKQMNDEILEITPPPLPFRPTEKIFQCTDDEGNVIGDPYSYDDWIEMIHSISGAGPSLLGGKEEEYNRPLPKSSYTMEVKIGERTKGKPQSYED